MPDIVTPEWVRDAVFYQIFPDRFAQSAAVPKPSNLEAMGRPPTIRGFKGGDLLGVVEHLDYIARPGRQRHLLHARSSSRPPTIATTPTITTRWTRMLGGNAGLPHPARRAAHARGIRVVLDGVFNHTSRGFFQFNHILENGPNSPYLDWFTIYGWPLRP